MHDGFKSKSKKKKTCTPTPSPIKTEVVSSKVEIGSVLF